MNKVYLFISLCTASCGLIGSISFGQKIAMQLDAAMKKLQAEDQFKHAIISMYVVDSKTGKLIFDHNSQMGLAPASCQKVVTSVTAFEMLGKTYTYKTGIGYDGTLINNTVSGNIYFMVSGDPTLGSWRWTETTIENIRQKILAALKEKNITAIEGDMIIDDSKWETRATPGGWVWEDIGNYYGAGARGLNWHENQYDLILKPGKKQGDSVQVLTTIPALQVSALINELKTGKEGSGDQSVIYLPEDGLIAYIRGTVPAGKDSFIVSGSIPNAAISFTNTMTGLFNNNGIRFTGKPRAGFSFSVNREKMTAPSTILLSLVSPVLDSINYWFLKNSVNLYGEALVKTIAYERKKFGATDSGINIIRDFWSERGIERSALKMIDGSGLSPANRVTTQALVTVMQYARGQSWFPSFYFALPETNGIKMKDGYISGVRSYTGYIKSRSGNEYTFSFIINNFDGSAGTVREKMWRLMDILK